MTTKQNAINLANTARSEAAAIANGTKHTIAQIVTNWNECVKLAGFMCIYDFPTTGYSRKSQIADDLLRCAAQLDDYCEPNPHAPQTVEQQTREINAALTRVLDVEEAHAEALKDDAVTNQTKYRGLPPFSKAVAHEEAHTEALEENYRFGWLANRFNLFWSGCDYSTRRGMTEHAHTEALAINIEIDQKKQKLEAIWKYTHRDYKGESEGARSILVCRNGTISVPLECLTDAEIEQRSYLWQKK